MNRETRRAGEHGRLSPVPLPGSRPVTVQRSVPVSVIARADGTTETINHEADEPCFGCSCCALWSRTLDTLADAMREHEHGEHGESRLPGCLVCQVLTGATDRKDG